MGLVLMFILLIFFLFFFFLFFFFFFFFFFILFFFFFFFFFFFNDTATTEIYTLSLHDALPNSMSVSAASSTKLAILLPRAITSSEASRSEEHTSELQSPVQLVCRILLEKK